MARISPFRALRYNPEQVKLADVATQPYDKITPEMQDRYYAASPYNLVRIILGKQEGEGTVYTRADDFFRGWRKQGILLQDRQPSIYAYRQRFRVPGQSGERERMGFVALGQVEDYSAGIVFRHEQTLAKPKADRLELLRATRAHFGQIFMLYSDSSGEIQHALEAADRPVIDFADEFGVQQQVWQVSDPAVIGTVTSKMQDKKLIIADGHHRYETALTYRNECRAVASTNATSGNAAAYEFVMMTFVNMESPGLIILPTHRVVHGLASFSADSLREQARRYFSVEEVDSSITAPRALAILREARHVGTALLAVTADRCFLLDRPVEKPEMFQGMSMRQQSLDVLQLHKYLLEKALGISEDAIRDQRNIRYIRDAEEAIAQVRQHGADVAFLMNPVRIAQVRDIALAGEVMPQKSTDFYPKLLSGLTIYALD